MPRTAAYTRAAFAQQPRRCERGAHADCRSDSVALTTLGASNDGTTIHKPNVKDEPLDGFWSVSLYNAEVIFTRMNTMHMHSTISRGCGRFDHDANSVVAMKRLLELRRSSRHQAGGLRGWRWIMIVSCPPRRRWFGWRTPPPAFSATKQIKPPGVAPGLKEADNAFLHPRFGIPGGRHQPFSRSYADRDRTSPAQRRFEVAVQNL
jgi:hypothetical protein